MPPKKKTGGSQTKAAARNSAKFGKLNKVGNGDRGNKNKQSEIGAATSISREVVIEQNDKKTAVGSRSRKRNNEEKTPESATVAIAVVREDGQDMTLQVSTEQEAKFASEDNDNDATLSGVSTPWGKREMKWSPHRIHRAAVPMKHQTQVNHWW